MKKETLRLYAVTPCDCAMESVHTILQHGATFLQLREKNLSRDAFIAKAQAMRAICPKGVPFVINDDLDVALACEADGAHIGQSDGSVAEARRRLGPGRILGVSAGTVAEAIAAEREGADYIGVGAMFPTQTKDDAAAISLDTLHAICASISIPVVAIGGITEGNVMQLAGSGIAGVALVSALFGMEDPAAATERWDTATRELLRVPTEVRRGALVDMDGTVLDSIGVWEAMDREITARYNVANREAVLKHLTTVLHLREGAQYLHEQCGAGASTEALCDEFTALLRTYYEEIIPLLPGAKEALQRMHDDGVRLALVTATEEPLARAALRRTGVEHLFSHSFFNVNKRGPEALYPILDVLGTGLRESTLIDDVPAIRTMAATAGLSTQEAL